MLQLFKYEFMALDAMGKVVIERQHQMPSLKLMSVVGLCTDINDDDTDAVFCAKVVNVNEGIHTCYYTLVAVRS